MLLKYIVSNFKSIGHDIEFTMFPSEDLKDQRHLTTINTKQGKWTILRKAAFFGANASGKSNFIQSINFGLKYIINHQKSGDNININQFKGNFDDIGNISKFQFMFYINGEVYNYGFAVDNEKVHEEWLMILVEDGFDIIFERELHNVKITNLLKTKDTDIEIANLLKETLQKNQLFLYKLFDNKIKKAEDIIKWFSSIQIIFPSTEPKGLLSCILQNEDFKNYLSEKLFEFDTGTMKLLVDYIDVIPEESIYFNKVLDKIKELTRMSEIDILESSSKVFYSKEENKMYVLKFQHILNNQEVEFDIEEESDGTKRLLELLPILFSCYKNNVIYIIDEIDRSLHTKLLQYFIKTFNNISEISENQLIFSTHDVNLIDLDIMRQDEIWFLEKNNLGETEIKPLSDYNIQKNYDVIKAYLLGRFGAVPNLWEVNYSDK